MAAHPISDDDIKRIIQAYIDGGRVISEVQRTTGFSRGTVQKYVWAWERGTLQVPGIANFDAEANAEPTASVAEYGYKRQITTLKRERDLLLKEREEQQRLLQLFGFIREARLQIPDWTTKKPKSGEKHKAAIATAFFSDIHLDEIVRPEQVNFVNAYNREIAEKRVRLFFEHAVEIARDYLHGLTYEGLVLPLGGDIFSGLIHEELVETNAATIFESMLYWAEPICAGIKLLQDAFGRVFLPCVVGNHGRRQRKPHSKNRAQDNFDWFFYHLLRKLLRDEKGLDFAISESADQPYTVFETRYLLTHGDQFRGGSGIAGMLSPLMLGDHRKRRREQAVQRPYHELIIGHWHQLAFLPGLIVNGAGKGYDEYAFDHNFGFEPPQQAFWITDPVHGRTITAPIFVQAKDEQWSASTGDKAYRSMEAR